MIIRPTVRDIVDTIVPDVVRGAGALPWESPAARVGWNPSGIPGYYAEWRADRGITLGTQPSFSNPTAFDNAAWTKGNTSVTVTNQPDPDGTSLADRIDDSNPGSDVAHNVQQAPSNLNEGRCSVTIDAKKVAGVDFLVITISTNVSAWFNLQTGAVGTTQAGVTATITPLAGGGGGWYRCTATGPYVSGNIQLGLAQTDADTSYNSTGVGGQILLHNARIEQNRVNTWADQERLVAIHDMSRSVVGTQPVYRSDDGRPYVVAQTGDWLDSGVAADWKFLHDGTGGWSFLAFDTTGATASQIYDTNGGTGANVGISAGHVTAGGGNLFAQVSNGGANIMLYNTAGAQPPGKYLLSYGYLEDGSGAECWVRVNGAYVLGPAASGGAPSASNPLGPLTLLARTSTHASAFINGKFFHALIIKRATQLTLAEIQYIEQGMRSLWGI